MKIIITENKLEKVLKKNGTVKVFKLLGNSGENFRKVFNIETPMDFLHLFDDLDVVQSEKDENLTLFRYQEGDNYMVLDESLEYKRIFVSYANLVWFLEDTFELNYPGQCGQAITQWLEESYNITNVTPILYTTRQNSNIL
jgi:hypothetical protein